MGLLRWFKDKESTCNAGDPDLIPGLGRSPGGENGNPLQHSCLENPHGQRNLVGYSAWGCKESNRTKWLSTAHPRVQFSSRQWDFCDQSSFFTRKLGYLTPDCRIIRKWEELNFQVPMEWYWLKGKRSSHPLINHSSFPLWSMERINRLSKVLCDQGFPGGSDGKESTCSKADLGLIPELGRSPGGGQGNPLQYSCLENPHGQRSLAGYIIHGVEKSQTQLND